MALKMEAKFGWELKLFQSRNQLLFRMVMAAVGILGDWVDCAAFPILNHTEMMTMILLYLCAYNIASLVSEWWVIEMD